MVEQRGSYTLFQLGVSSNYGNISLTFCYLGEMFLTTIFPNDEMEIMSICNLNVFCSLNIKPLRGCSDMLIIDMLPVVSSEITESDSLHVSAQTPAAEQMFCPNKRVYE